MEPNEDIKLDTRQLATLAGIFVVVTLLWNTPVVAPLKIFVVLLHEISHGLAAIVTGGSISHIEINVNQGGVCYTRGGSRFITLSAGYLGSMFWGGLIMLAASRLEIDRIVSIVIGVGVGLVTLLYVRSWFGFGFALAASAAMIGAGWKLSHDVNDLILKTIGVTSCMYAPLDIFSDVIARPNACSDAAMLADITYIPTIVWGILWIVLAVVAVAWFFYLSIRSG